MTPLSLGIFASASFLPTSFESIATVTVGSGGAANVEFTSIPSTFRHLQIRAIARSNNASGVYGNLTFRFNSDTGNVYSRHFVAGTFGSGTGTATSGSDLNTNFIYDGLTQRGPGSGTANLFAANIIDILDYANTNKFKSIRIFSGVDDNTNAAGQVKLESGLWESTSAITSITIDIEANTNSFEQYTHFALYGMRGV